MGMYMSNSRFNSNVPQALRNLGVTNMNIIILNLHNNNLTSLPESISKLTNLQILDLSENRITELPSSIGKLTNLVNLNLSENKITKLPSFIGKLTQLMTLDLGVNQLTKLPPQIGNLTKLLTLSLDYNKLKSLPPQIGNLERLTSLYLDNNKLESLPDEIGRLPNLQYLHVENNPNLRIIPRSLIRSSLKITKNNSTKFEHIPIVRRKVPINKVPLNINNKRSDSITMENFKVGHNGIYLGYNKYLHEKTLLNWIKTQNNNTNIININALYSRRPNDYIGVNPLTQKPLFRKNLNFVKFVKPNTPSTLAKKLNNTKINNKPKTQNSQNNIRKKAGNAAQSRRTNVNNNNR